MSPKGMRPSHPHQGRTFPYVELGCIKWLSVSGSCPFPVYSQHLPLSPCRYILQEKKMFWGKIVLSYSNTHM